MHHQRTNFRHQQNIIIKHIGSVGRMVSSSRLPPRDISVSGMPAYCSGWCQGMVWLTLASQSKPKPLNCSQRDG